MGIRNFADMGFGTCSRRALGGDSADGDLLDARDVGVDVPRVGHPRPPETARGRVYRRLAGERLWVTVTYAVLISSSRDHPCNVLILPWWTAASLKKARIIKAVVIIVTVVVTHLTMIYIYKRMDGIKEEVVYKRRKARCVGHFLYPTGSADGLLRVVRWPPL